MTEDDLFAFIGSSIGSVWALELVLLLKRDPEQCWSSADLIRELRSSRVVIDESLRRLQAAGLVMQSDPETFRYHATSPRLDELVSELEKAYQLKPMTVIKAVVAAPSDKLRAFSDAFKLKE